MTFQSAIARRPFLAIASTLLHGAPVEMCDAASWPQSQRKTVRHTLDAIKGPPRAKSHHGTRFNKNTDDVVREKVDKMLRHIHGHSKQVVVQVDKRVKEMIKDRLTKSVEPSNLEEELLFVTTPNKDADVVIELTPDNYDKKVARSNVMQGLVHVIMTGVAAKVRSGAETTTVGEKDGALSPTKQILFNWMPDDKSDLYHAINTDNGSYTFLRVKDTIAKFHDHLSSVAIGERNKIADSSFTKEAIQKRSNLDISTETLETQYNHEKPSHTKAECIHTEMDTLLNGLMTDGSEGEKLYRVLSCCREYVEYVNVAVESAPPKVLSDFESFSRSKFAELKKTSGNSVHGLEICKSGDKTENLEARLTGNENTFQLPMWFLARRQLDRKDGNKYGDIARELMVTVDEVKEVLEEIEAKEYAENLGERVAFFQAAWPCITQSSIRLQKDKDSGKNVSLPMMQRLESVWQALNIQKVHALRHFKSGFKTTLEKKLDSVPKSEASVAVKAPKAGDQAQSKNSESPTQVQILERVKEAIIETATAATSADTAHEHEHFVKALELIRLSCKAKFMLGASPDTFKIEAADKKFQNLWTFASPNMTYKATEQETAWSNDGETKSPDNQYYYFVKDDYDHSQMKCGRFANDSGTGVRGNDCSLRYEGNNKGPAVTDAEPGHFIPCMFNPNTYEPFVVKTTDNNSSKDAAKTVVVCNGADVNQSKSIKGELLYRVGESMKYDNSFIGSVVDRMDKGMMRAAVVDLFAELYNSVFEDAWRRYGLFLMDQYANSQVSGGFDSLQFGACVAVIITEELQNIQKEKDGIAKDAADGSGYLDAANMSIAHLVRSSTKLKADFGAALMAALSHLSRHSNGDKPVERYTNIQLSKDDEKSLHPAICMGEQDEP